MLETQYRYDYSGERGLSCILDVAERKQGLKNMIYVAIYWLHEHFATLKGVARQRKRHLSQQQCSSGIVIKPIKVVRCILLLGLPPPSFIL